MTLTEKVAYLKGLVEGIGVDETTNQGKIMKAVLDVLDDMAFTVSDLEDSTSELYEEVEAIDEDLSSLEDEFYGDEDDDECDCDCCCDDDDDDCDCCCDDDDDDDLYELECPNCGDKIYITEDMLNGSIECPNCNTKIDDIEVEDEDESDED